jgi:hypothetical protein
MILEHCDGDTPRAKFRSALARERFPKQADPHHASSDQYSMDYPPAAYWLTSLGVYRDEAIWNG